MAEEISFDAVKANYGEIASNQLNKSCCDDEADVLSLGCYSELVEKAQIKEGDTVLDLGCGPGRDVLAAVAKVGESGFIFGLDMTDEMLELARKNTSDYDNIEIIRGNLQEIPLSDESIDVIISNCVFNLTLDKLKAFSESFRVLKKGGRIVESDVALEYELSEDERSIQQVYSGCIGGAIPQRDYEEFMEKAGFVDIESMKLHSGTYKLRGKQYPYNSVLFTGYKL